MKKIFISYSWENPKTEAKVLELANRLTNPMVKVILDKWDLKAGHDMNLFMEESVEIADNVLIICDKSYKNKANKRTGGVGTETQIISPDVYTSVKQEKFIPIFFEKDEDGFAVPTFLKGRLGVTLLEDTISKEKVDEILKTLYDINDNTRPTTNEIPDFLKDIKATKVTNNENISTVLVVDGDSLLKQISDVKVKQRFIANQLSIAGIMSSINRNIKEIDLNGTLEEVELIISKNKLSEFDPQLSEVLLHRIKSEDNVFVSVLESNDESYLNRVKEIIAEQFESSNQVLVITQDNRFVEEFNSFRRQKNKIINVEVGSEYSIDIRNVCSKRIEMYRDFNDFFVYSYPTYYINRMKLEDFEDLIANADDRKHNQLRVYPNGEVFISLEVGAENIRDLQFRWDSFDAYNDYVGVRAASDNEYSTEEFDRLEKDWKSGRRGYADYRL